MPPFSENQTRERSSERYASCLYLQRIMTIAAMCFCVSAAATETVNLKPHTFTIPDGYELKRVAGPPLVQRPMHMCFDEEGVLYVTDSSGDTRKAPVQLKEPSHRILRLVDRDGDGTFDESTVFADELPFPEGILVHEGAVYVGAPPHIWKLRDSDGDHVADERTVWFDGGSIENCGNDMHGPYLGPDGFFYWCKGAFAPQEHELTNGRTLTSHAAHIYRSRPDGSQLERVITGGTNNPVGLTFDETGERFLCGTFFDLSKPGRRDGILQAVYGGMYGRKKERVLDPHPNTGRLLPIMSQLGPAAPSGMLMPRHPGSELKGDLICTEFNTRRLSRHRLSQSGSSYSADTSTFLESDQTDFHPTDVIEDADGSLLVADTGSWYMICCPTSKIAKPHVFGSIYRIQKKGSKDHEDPRGLKLDWSHPQVSWLADSRPAVVKRAIDSLASANNIDALRSSSASVSAVWVLHRISGGRARAAVRDFLSAEEPDVCAAAIHSVALWRDREALARLIEILSQDDPQLRRLAAMALGRLGDREAAGPLLQAHSTDMDPFLSHAIAYALYEIGDVKSLPESHPLGEQVLLMRKADERIIQADAYPKILPVKWKKPDQEELAQQEQRLNELSAYLSEGDAERGAKLFNNQDRSKCTICHLKGNQGVRLGPDLTWIGAIRSERDLLEAIVYPSASIARYHEVVNVLTKDGSVVSGLLVRETAREMFLSSAEGVVQPVAYGDIEQARYSRSSLMPEGLDKLLRPEEIADLVAYLKASKPSANGSRIEK
jgi:putative membrane-bound dehydrogenase-like protein